MVNISEDHHVHKSVKTEPKRVVSASQHGCCVEVAAPVKVETVESHHQAQTTPQATQHYTMQSNVQAKSGMADLLTLDDLYYLSFST